MKKNKKQKVVEKFVTFIEKITKHSSVPRYFDTDVKIYRSEIHIIGVIGDNKDIHISEIARKFGVTKGAISKTIKKFTQKGLVEKIIDKTNNTRTLIRLTEKGMKAYHAHKRYHNENDKEMFSYLDSLTEHELDTLYTFLEKANSMAKRHS